MGKSPGQGLEKMSMTKVEKLVFVQYDGKNYKAAQPQTVSALKHAFHIFLD